MEKTLSVGGLNRMSFDVMKWPLSKGEEIVAQFAFIFIVYIQNVFQMSACLVSVVHLTHYKWRTFRR